jgi:hypothetical protein
MCRARRPSLLSWVLRGRQLPHRARAPVSHGQELPGILDQGHPFELRLLRAIEACDAAGGDLRGRQSAAILVMHRESYPLFDFRVDHHPDPLRVMGEILEETRQSYYINFRATLPTDASVATDIPNPFPTTVPHLDPFPIRSKPIPPHHWLPDGRLQTDVGGSDQIRM